MRKWVVLALGVLLAVAGLISLWQGIGQIEFERGLAAVISGAVLLAGGVITIALYFVLNALEGLQIAPRAFAAPVLVPPEIKPVEAPVAEPPLKQEPKPEPEPQPEFKLPTAPPLPPLPAREEVPLPKFEFPKAETPAPEPAPAPSAAPAIAVATTAAAATGGFFAIRNFFSRRAEPVKAVEPESTAESDEVTAPKLPDFLVRRDVMGDQLKAEEIEPAQDEATSPEEGAAAEEVPPQGASDQDKYAWLEKALSGDEEEKPEPEFDWLRNRSSVEPSKDPILEEVSEEEVFEEEEIIEERVEEASAPETVEPSAPVAPPTVVGRYNSAGSEYTLYSDGSIDAETAEGHLHFASMADLRAHIEAQQNRG